MSDADKLRARIPLSPGVIALNPGIFGGASESSWCWPEPQPVKKSHPEQAKPRKRAEMNKTERSFSNWLEAQKRRGEILSYHREGLTLRWEDGMTYTADFFVENKNSLELIEVKGPWIRDDAKVKYRAARDKWKSMFIFSMWQLTKGEWHKIL